MAKRAEPLFPATSQVLLGPCSLCKWISTDKWHSGRQRPHRTLGEKKKKSHYAD